MNFNTSHVNVNHNVINKNLGEPTYFNTSHVNVNRTQSLHRILQQLYFNTSHVNVNLNGKCKRLGDRPISIHLMLMLISITDIENPIAIYISIHLMLMLIQ